MKLLLDTHTFIWWDSEPSKLSQHALELCNDANNILVLSVVSIWEMQIKSQLGKLTLNLPLEELVRTHQQVNNFQILPIDLTHVLDLEGLSLHHKDPFDRLLIAQANVENAILVSKDPIFSAYGVQVAW